MKLKKYFNTILNSSPKHTAWLVARKLWPQKFRGAFDNLEKLPRYTEAEVSILGKKIKIADAPSFLFMYDEIFRNEIYKFKTEAEKPFIIDCGANIGLSVIYCKNLFPSAEIIGFEPDPKIFAILENNIKSFGYDNIKLEQKAVYSEETEINFYSEGADGGRMAEKTDDKIIKVKTARLRDYLNRPVDFLKIDIEGAETDVIKDCADLLPNVKNLFVEYHSFADKKQELTQLLSALENAGLRYYVQDIGVKSAHPFYKKDVYAGFDMQLNIFACRF